MAKKSGNGDGTIRQRPNGRWEARYTVGFNPGTGKQIRKSVYGETRQEVSKKLRAATSAIDTGTYSEPSKVSVGQWLDDWSKLYLGSVKPATVISYTQHITNHLKPAFGSIRLQSLDTNMIQKLYNKLEKDGRSPKTIKNLHGVLHSALKQAARLGYIRVNPSDNCKLPRIEKTEMKPLDTPEIAAFLETIKDTTFEALYTVDVFTGMREGEILGLTWGNVDFERGQIYVCKQLNRPRAKGGIYSFGSLKNDKPRTVCPAPYVMEILKTHKRKQAAMRLKAGELWDEGAFPGLVFTNEIGGHLVYATVYKHFRKALEAAGIPLKRFHDLRHTYAVSSIRSGDDIKTVQENLGHHTAAFTLEQYGHVTETMRRESAQRMEGFIKGLKSGN